MLQIKHLINKLNSYTEREEKILKNLERNNERKYLDDLKIAKSSAIRIIMLSEVS